MDPLALLQVRLQSSADASRIGLLTLSVLSSCLLMVPPPQTLLQVSPGWIGNRF